MQINIDGRTLEVPEAYVHELAEQVWGLLEAMYETKVPDFAKAGTDVLIKTLLLKAETTTRIQHGREAAMLYRVPAKESPTLWMARQMFPLMKESLSHATITCKTELDTVTDFKVQLPHIVSTGGQVDTTGRERLRENDGLKVS